MRVVTLSHDYPYPPEMVWNIATDFAALWSRALRLSEEGPRLEHRLMGLRTNIFTRIVAAALLVLFGYTAGAAAQDANPTIVIKDHAFHPAEVHVAANTVVFLTIDNQDPTPEEFESHELRVEKIIPGELSGVVRIGPLKPGTYPFFGDFNQATAQGKVVAE